jgi:hypothetical protein
MKSNRDRDMHLEIAFSLDSSYEDVHSATKKCFVNRSGEKRLWRRTLGVLLQMVRADGHQNRGMYFPPFFCTNASSAKAPRRRILLAKK